VLFVAATVVGAPSHVDEQASQTARTVQNYRVGQIRTRLVAALHDWWDEQEADPSISIMLGRNMKGLRSASRFVLDTFIGEVAEQLQLHPPSATCLDWDARYVNKFRACRKIYNFKFADKNNMFREASIGHRGLIQGNLGNLSHVPSGILDLALVTQVFEHVPHFWKALPELARLIAVHGVVIFTVPWAYDYHPFPGDFWRFSLGAIVHMFESAGFTICNLASDGTRSHQMQALGLQVEPEQEGELKNYLMRSNHNASLLRSPSGHFLIAQKPALLQAHSRCTLPRMQLTNEIARSDVNGYIPLPDPAAFS